MSIDWLILELKEGEITERKRATFRPFYMVTARCSYSVGQRDSDSCLDM